MKYESETRVESAERPGVWFRVRRMSFGRRLELTRRLRALLGRLEFVEAGEDGPARDAEAALLGGEIDREHLIWGLAGVEGFEIDGSAATPETLIEVGPEELVREALRVVRREAGLSEDERKNSESHSTSSMEAEPGGIATTADGAVWSESGAAVGLRI